MGKIWLNMANFYKSWDKVIDANISPEDMKFHENINNVGDVIQEAAMRDKELSLQIKQDPICMNIDEKMQRTLKFMPMNDFLELLENISHHREPNLRILESLMLRPGKTDVKKFRDNACSYAGILSPAIIQKNSQWTEGKRTKTTIGLGKLGKPPQRTKTQQWYQPRP